MQPKAIFIFLITACMAATPVASHAFWGSGDNQNGLNLESGYDANTVTSITGRIVSIQAGEDRRTAQLEIESGGVRSVVVLGPQRYWSEHGIALKTGDDVTVRGSKAQGSDGVVYILTQKITDTTQKTTVTLRSESGRPSWAAGGMGNSPGQMNTRPSPMRQQSPGRMGGGRMGH